MQSGGGELGKCMCPDVEDGGAGCTSLGFCALGRCSLKSLQITHQKPSDGSSSRGFPSVVF